MPGGDRGRTRMVGAGLQLGPRATPGVGLSLGRHRVERRSDRGRACRLAARDHAHADEIISTWLATTPTADMTVWYEAPSRLD
jgi:hypothetical protein